MGVLEKISEVLYDNEEKTVELRQKILTLILEWGCFDKDLKLPNNCLKECFTDTRESLERKEEELELKWKKLSAARRGFAETVKLREEKLNDQEKMVERLWEEVEFERKQIGDVEEKLMGIHAKEKELNKIQIWIRHETQALELKDQELAEKMEEFQKLQSMKKEYDVKVMGLESIKNELRTIENNLDNVKKELKESESNLESVKKDVIFQESKLDNAKKELRVTENNLDYVKKELKENKNNLESLKKDITFQEGKLDSMTKELRAKESKLEVLKKEIREKENNLEFVNKALVVKGNRLDGVQKVLRVKEGSLNCVEKELRENKKTMDYVKKELREKETNLNSMKKELAVIENMLDGMKKELTLKGSNLDVVVKELREKEKKMDNVNKELWEKKTNLDSMKKEIAVLENMSDSMKKELTLKESNLDVVRKELKERVKNLNFVETELREKVNELESVKNEFKAEVDNLNALRKQVESNEEISSSMKKEFEHKEKFLGAMKKKLELQEEHLKSFSERLHLREIELDSTQEAYEQRVEMLNSKEKKLDSAEEFTKKSYEGFQSEKRRFLVEQGLFEQRMKDVILREERIKDRLEELESREKHFEDRCRELREKEKQLNGIPNVHLKTQATEDVTVDRVYTIVGNSAVTRFAVIMDGKSLLIFLNEHEKELDLMSDDVFEALQMSPDPAKLVLDAMEGFYPPHLRKGETEIEGSVARRSCILLLEQLIRVSPEIQGSTRETARCIARDWKVKIKATEGNQDEILVFLYLLTAYKLVSFFDADELMILLEIVAKHDKFAELCRSLGMKQNLPCFVQNLLTKQQHLEAIRYVYAFELVDHFPPTAILKDYLERVERNYVCVLEKETCSAEEKIEAIERRVASVRAVIRCILDYKLQSQNPVEQLEEMIEFLTRQKEDQAALSLICEAKRPEQGNVDQMGSTNPSIPTGTKALNSLSVSAKACACTFDHSNTMAIILMNMSGKNLQNFLNKHSKEHKLLRSEVFSALQMSLDSDMLVLEALGGFYPPNHQREEIGLHRNIIRQSCILLLEQLMELSREIIPEAKLKASKLAFAWKAKMMAEMENHLTILGFLLLVGCYRLSSAFDKDELESLYHKVAHHVNTSKICHVLGISDNTSKKSKRHQAQGCTDESICDDMDINGDGHDVICHCASSSHCTSDPALLVLDVFLSCHPTKIVRCENFPSVMRAFSDLLDQLRGVSPEIELHVKKEAFVFASDWYSTLIGSEVNPTEVVVFLQFLAIYKITDSFHPDGLLGLLEKVQPTERVVSLVKILGLTDEIQWLVQNLRNKKQWLVAFNYVYAFELVNLVSPVLLLKDYVSHSKQIAKRILHTGNSSYQAQIKAMNCEIYALRNAARHIVDRGLQSEYSPFCLERQIERLQYQMSNLRQSDSNWDLTAKFQQDEPNNGTCESAPFAQVRKEFTRKRSAPAGETYAIYRAQQTQYFKRPCHLSMRR
ncbi:FRIGIDA-like protein 5 isoform X2 [Solanum verrucosum]|uniref:FRIGIDA-like protein 5 isoform X2 n=1 Tax=Solanum verrucosum TaxID=315347 RepID=UPI0020D19F66|nr:FRIGIDA-like protein 5 isoform X2 [Solanum verrucosum]